MAELDPDLYKTPGHPAVRRGLTLGPPPLQGVHVSPSLFDSLVGPPGFWGIWVGLL